MVKEILSETTSTQDELIELISSLEEKQLNAIPFEGSWTAAQLAVHLIKSGKGMVQVMNGNVETSDRPADQKVPTIKKIFLDFSTKMKAPEFIIPSPELSEKDRLIQSLQKIKEGLIKSINSLDLTMTCTDFELPGMGKMTRLEWSNFVLYHTQRHLHQLRHIISELSIAK